MGGTKFLEDDQARAELVCLFDQRVFQHRDALLPPRHVAVEYAFACNAPTIMPPRAQEGRPRAANGVDPGIP